MIRSPARLALAALAIGFGLWLGVLRLGGPADAQTAALPTAVVKARMAAPAPQAALSDRTLIEATKRDVAQNPATSAAPQMSAAASGVQNPTKSTSPPRLQLVPLAENSSPEGCGCFFYRPTDKRELGPLLMVMNERGEATIRPEGQLVTLRLVDEQHSRRDPKTISAQDRVLLKLRGGQTNASISGMAERNCPRSSGGTTCASVSYQSLLNIDHQGRRSTLPAWGFCGCR